MKEKRNTLQKRIVTDVFGEMTNHPSAGMVYEAVQEKYPSISKATVYRILAEAAEEGKIQRLKLVDANDRYDFTLTKHYHVVCKECGSVADVKCEVDDVSLVQNACGCEDFMLQECHLEFVGICSKCQTKTQQG